MLNPVNDRDATASGAKGLEKGLDREPRKNIFRLLRRDIKTIALVQWGRK